MGAALGGALFIRAASRSAPRLSETKGHGPRPELLTLGLACNTPRRRPWNLVETSRRIYIASNTDVHSWKDPGPIIQLISSMSKSFSTTPTRPPAAPSPRPPRPARPRRPRHPTARRWHGARRSTNIYVCLHISAAKRPPVAYEVPLCAVPYVQYAWGPVGTAKCPSQ